MNTASAISPSARRAQEYEPVWQELAAAVDARVAAGERNLSRVVSSVYHEWRGHDVARANGVAFGEVVALPRSALAGARRALIAQTVIAACRPDTSLIVELGSGPGLNLCDVFLGGGPPGAAYAGLELTRSGRDCLTKLAALDDGFDCEARFFDYHAPDLRLLDDHRGHLVVFTVHSIEQIREISGELFEQIIDRADRVSGIHFEPVGWQIEGRESGRYSSRAYAQSAGYNENLLQILSELESRSRLTVDSIVPDIFSHKAKNASTLVTWTTAGRAP